MQDVEIEACETCDGKQKVKEMILMRWEDCPECKPKKSFLVVEESHKVIDAEH